MISGTAGENFGNVTTSTFDSSVRRNAIAEESSDHQNPAVAWSKISSQYTQDRAPFRIVGLPSEVSRVSRFAARSYT